ncbi:alkaline ceramidase [Rosistilla oblonga]|uniref:alkaline ceramidase n=1 Tax=Rosistilla oblonga TaxID=2527990 RepID=UPI003A9859DD
MSDSTATVPAFHHAAFHGRVGIALNDITPPVGIYSRNWGAAAHDVADSIHRSLTLTATTIASLSGESPLVLIDADLGWWRTPELFPRFQQRLLEEFSLDSSQLIFALTHTHAGPPLLESTDPLPGMELTKPWLDSLLETAVTTVRQAFADASEATLEWRTGHCGLATTRDLPDPDSESDRFLCGFDPEGQADGTLLLGRVTDAQGNLRATIVNYACHPTTLAWENTAISPDYIGAMRETIQQATGAPAVFLLGACGDQAPRYQYVGDTTVADGHGRELGYAALSTLAGMEPAGTQLAFEGAVTSGAPLAKWRHQPRKASEKIASVESSVDLPLKDWPSAAELEAQRIACTDRTLQERLLRRRDIRLRLGDGTTYPLPLNIWRMGDAVLVGSCCEAYSMLQRELRKRFPNNAIICMNLINGTIGYLPPADLYDKDVYAVWQTPFDRGCLEATLETLTQEIDDILR